jgi:hypothetical protein
LGNRKAASRTEETTTLTKAPVLVAEHDRKELRSFESALRLKIGQLSVLEFE